MRHILPVNLNDKKFNNVNIEWSNNKCSHASEIKWLASYDFNYEIDVCLSYSGNKFYYIANMNGK